MGGVSSLNVIAVGTPLLHLTVAGVCRDTDISAKGVALIGFSVILHYTT